jgi:hypothetical protein
MSEAAAFTSASCTIQSPVSQAVKLNIVLNNIPCIKLNIVHTRLADMASSC